MDDELSGSLGVTAPYPGARMRLVTIEGVELRRTSCDALRTAGIQDTDPVSESDVHEAIDEAEPEAAMNRALRLLGHRERSVQELVGRLARDGYPDAVIAPVTERLLDYGYLDDARFAHGYVRSKHAAGWGRTRIAKGLADKGVEPIIAANALDAVAPGCGEVERARASIRGLDTFDRAGESRALRRLVYRGFSYEVARAALEAHRADYEGDDMTSQS